MLIIFPQAMLHAVKDSASCAAGNASCCQRQRFISKKLPPSRDTREQEGLFSRIYFVFCPTDLNGFVIDPSHAEFTVEQGVPTAQT